MAIVQDAPPGFLGQEPERPHAIQMLSPLKTATIPDKGKAPTCPPRPPRLPPRLPPRPRSRWASWASPPPRLPALARFAWFMAMVIASVRALGEVLKEADVEEPLGGRSLDTGKTAGLLFRRRVSNARSSRSRETSGMSLLAALVALRCNREELTHSREPGNSCRMTVVPGGQCRCTW